MSLPTRIVDGHLVADLVHQDGDTGLFVFTQPKYSPTPFFLPFANSDFGNSLNQDASAGGTPINIHDGTDNTYWTGNQIVGTDVNFSSTNRANSGTQSVRANSPDLGDVWEFDNGSDQSLSGYVSISGQININRRYTAGDVVTMYGWRNGAQVGDAVDISNYINILDNDVWQAFVVPLTDMSLDGQTIDAIRFEQGAINGQSPDWFLDDFNIEETGDTIEYRANKAADKDFFVHEIILTAADVYAGTLANGAGQIPSPYNGLLGLTRLPVGITIRVVQNGVVIRTGNFKGLDDFLAVGFEISNSGSDGTNSFITLRQNLRDCIQLTGPPSENYISATINDDLSGLLRLNITAKGAEQT